MKKTSLILAILLVLSFSVFAMASVEDESSENKTVDQGSGTASGSVDKGSNNDASGSVSKGDDSDNTRLGNYSIVIDSCRLAKDYEGNDVVIVKYIFGNVSGDDAVSFVATLNYEVYQNGVGLNEAYFVEDDANYSSDNQLKEIKKGATIEVEVAYVLEDTVSPIEVEVSEWLSWDDVTLTKTFAFN